MKQFFTGLLVFSLVATLVQVAFGQTPRVSIYADMNRTSCSLVDNVSPPVVYVYYFLENSPGATAVAFEAPKPLCWAGASFAGDLNPYTAIGNTQAGWVVAFGACLSGTTYIGNTLYIVGGQGTPCCQISATIGFNGFEYIDCDFQPHPIESGQRVTINPNATCPCNGPLAAEESTWGRVKSLYR